MILVSSDCVRNHQTLRFLVIFLWPWRNGPPLSKKCCLVSLTRRQTSGGGLKDRLFCRLDKATKTSSLWQYFVALAKRQKIAPCNFILQLLELHALQMNLFYGYPAEHLLEIETFFGPQLTFKYFWCVETIWTIPLLSCIFSRLESWLFWSIRRYRRFQPYYAVINLISIMDNK